RARVGTLCCLATLTPSPKENLSHGLEVVTRDRRAVAEEVPARTRLDERPGATVRRWRVPDGTHSTRRESPAGLRPHHGAPTASHHEGRCQRKVEIDRTPSSADARSLSARRNHPERARARLRDHGGRRTSDPTAEVVASPPLIQLDWTRRGTCKVCRREKEVYAAE